MKLSVLVNQPVLIDKPGGNTVMSADNGTMVFNTAWYSKVSYDPQKDLAPVTVMGPMILVVGPASDAKDARLHRQGQATRDQLRLRGRGRPHHLAMELLKVNAGVHLVHIPYRGAAPALQDLSGGQFPAIMVDLAAGAGFIKAGKIRALAGPTPRACRSFPMCRRLRSSD